jgi:hypothetical protein
MKRGSIRVVATLAAVWACSVGLSVVRGQQAAATKPLMAEDVFKNITMLRGIPVNDFMLTMGAFSAALGMSCQDCHSANDRDWGAFALDNPRKNTARRMIGIMQEINKTHFGGRQVVTCFSCHRGSDRPKMDYDLNVLYGEPPPNPSFLIGQAPTAPKPDEVLDKFIQALGGAQRLGAIKSFTAKGESLGYGPESGSPRPVDIYAEAPNRLTMAIHTDSGDDTRTVDGTRGWHSAPFRPRPVLELAGQDLEGLRFDAMLAFPAQIKTAARGWRVGFPSIIDDRDVQVVQGTLAGGTVVTLYFDDETGLLTRQMRYISSPIGPLTTEVTYSDYKEVSGVKMPHKLTLRWLNGRENIELSEVRVNVAIPAARFAQPPPPVAPRR